MAAHSRPEIIKGLKEFDTDKDGKKIDRSGKIYIPSLKKEVEYTYADFYEALSWVGLKNEDSKDNKVVETEAWRKFKHDNPEKAEIYTYIGSDEFRKFQNQIQPFELAPIEVIGEKDSIK